MLGLIKKDLLMIKGNLKTLAIIFIVFLIMSANGNENFAFIPAFISIIIIMTTFSYDEYNKTDAFVTTLPNGKKNAVKSKYISTIVIVIIAVLLTAIMITLIGVSQNNLNIENILSITIGCCGAILIIQSILYPIIYKWGIEKSRIGMFIGIFAISGIASILLKNGANIKIPASLLTLLDNYWFIILPVMALVILYISYKISTRIYTKKEF